MPKPKKFDKVVKICFKCDKKWAEKYLPDMNRSEYIRNHIELVAKYKEKNERYKNFIIKVREELIQDGMVLLPTMKEFEEILKI